MSDSPDLSLIATLRDALSAARGVRSRDDLTIALDRIAELIAQALGYRSVAINLHRPAWDDFEATTVHGSEEARRALLGKASTWEQWAPYLASRFERRGTHHIPAGSLADRPGGLPMYRPDGAPSQADDQWDPDDLLLAVMRRGNGDVLGIVSVDEPLSGLRPTDADRDRLVALTELAGLAVEQAGSAERGARHRAAMDRLLTLSARTGQARGRAQTLEAVGAAVRETLGFGRVAVLHAEQGGLLRPVATAGWTLHDPVFSHAAFTPAQLEPILQPAHERHGCHLIARDDAEATLHLQTTIYRSQTNGRGPYAWERHWLLAALRDEAGVLIGVLWADDPGDRLLPDRETLQALRLLADHAAAALTGDAGPEILPAPFHEQDPLTGLMTRPKLADRLRHALQRVKRAEETVAVLFIDLDNFQHANDTLGHNAGDELLRVTAARIDEDLRPGDTVARFGGDEFVALCEDVASADEAMDIAERLRMLLAEPIPLAAGVAQVTASIGVALPDRPDRSAEALLQAADRAMYEAKAAGRDAARLATPGAGWP
ncbi:MAG TPA: GGDEF domain-containing protein [Baekduia sp.]|uniref:GGDEF domain-containing protein n=1 Tax=Baekduia sp. TaxID=2600305 RepID=UPI002D795E55|nr:GGDEF domain-containing protein [Baekduia sp.]HET6506345.1 GGDEF domain-containing protein [Baekduia sp.]